MFASARATQTCHKGANLIASFCKFMTSYLRKTLSSFFCLVYFIFYAKAAELPLIFALRGIRPCSIVK